MLSLPVHRQADMFVDEVRFVSLLGTIHPTRWRWNPFDPENRMTWNPSADRWEWRCFLKSCGGRHGDGVYLCRMLLNHNMRRVVKGRSLEEGPCWLVEESPLGNELSNIAFRVLSDDEYTLCLAADRKRFWIAASAHGRIEALSNASCFQMNGFVWDEKSMFKKFDERDPGRDFSRLDENTWEMSIPLRKDGGIDFRHDGVYQFLISADHNEDSGLSALNGRVDPVNGEIELVSGSGFGSSHGTSEHSAPTVRVSETGRYRFRLRKEGVRHFLRCWPEEEGSIRFLNAWKSVHLLGSVHEPTCFDPTQPQTRMTPVANSSRHELCLELPAKEYVINFALGEELFLDTMGLGCWLEDGADSDLRGIGWHGKPNEFNICFRVLQGGLVDFIYDTSDDSFVIHHRDGKDLLCRVDSLKELSLVGSFDAPLQAWDPAAFANTMNPIGGGRFERHVHLEQGRTYEYKYVANRSDWMMVFADYELDGYGMRLDGAGHPSPLDTDLWALKQHGHLTTHGNPPPLRYVPTQTGLHRFVVDLRTGAYAVMPM